MNQTTSMYEVFKPKTDLLKKHINEITVLKEKSTFPKEYFAFPHNVSSIVFIKDVEIKYSNHYLEINKSENKQWAVVLIGKYVEPLLVRYNAYVREIAINFSSTGINYFFGSEINEATKLPIQVLDNDSLNDFAVELFSLHKDERIHAVERFFEQRFRTRDIEIIEKIVHEVEQDKLVKFKDLALELHISTRSLNRLFHKYIGCSPKDYKKIIRFRGAIKEFNDKDFNLTEMSLKSDYYDSPHFTREFKKLTNMTPSEYFKRLTLESQERFPYIFR